MAKAAHVATVFGVMICVGGQATTSSPACLASEEPRSESGSSSRASMLLQVARSRDSSDSKPVTMDERDSSPVTRDSSDSKPVTRDSSDSKPVVRSRDSTPVTMGELLQHTEPLQSKLDDLNLKVTKLETDFGRNRGKDSKEEPDNEANNQDSNEANNEPRTNGKKGGEHKDVEKKVGEDARRRRNVKGSTTNEGGNGLDEKKIEPGTNGKKGGEHKDVNARRRRNVKGSTSNGGGDGLDETTMDTETNGKKGGEHKDVEKKVGENVRRRKGQEGLEMGEDWAWVQKEKKGEGLKKGEKCCDYPGNMPNKHCKTACGHGLMCVFVGDEVGPPRCDEEEFDKRSLLHVPTWDGVAPRAWNGLEKVNAEDLGDNASWKGTGRGVASGRPFSGEYPYETLMDVDFIIDSNPPWPSRKPTQQAKSAPKRRGKSSKGPKVAAKTSPRKGTKSSPSRESTAKTSSRSGAKSSPSKESKHMAKSSARSGAKTSPTDKTSPKGGGKSTPEP